MGKVVCKAVKLGVVSRRGRPSAEWYKDGKPQYYCCGYIDKMTDELIETCRQCEDNVIYAQDDLDRWHRREAK